MRWSSGFGKDGDRGKRSLMEMSEMRVWKEGARGVGKGRQRK